MTLTEKLAVADRVALYFALAVCGSFIIWLSVMKAKDEATVTDPVCRIVMPEKK